MSSSFWNESGSSESSQYINYYSQLPVNQTSHENWQEVFYASVPDIVHYVAGVYLGTGFVLGFVGNFFTIFSFLRNRNLRTPQNILFINQSIIDMTMVIFVLPLSTYACISRNFNFDSQRCRYSGTAASFAGIGSIISMTTIAYDRYVMVTFPMQSVYLGSTCRSVRLALFVWCYSAIFAILPNTKFVNNYILNGFRTSCSFDYVSRTWENRVWISIMYIFAFLLPVAIIFYCYTRIFLFVREGVMPKSGDTNQSIQAISNRRSLIQVQRELKLAKTLFICIALFLLAWMPYAIVALVGQFWGPQHISPYFSTIPAFLAKTNCVCNPFVYSLHHPSRSVLNSPYVRLRKAITAAIEVVNKEESKVVNLKQPTVEHTAANTANKCKEDCCENMESESAKPMRPATLNNKVLFAKGRSECNAEIILTPTSDA